MRGIEEAVVEVIKDVTNSPPANGVLILSLLLVLVLGAVQWQTGDRIERAINTQTMLLSRCFGDSKNVSLLAVSYDKSKEK